MTGIKAVSRSTKRLADLDGISREWTEDYGVIGFAIKFAPAGRYSGESYYAVDGSGETLGQIEMCGECGESWLGVPGSIHDEEHCIYCGAGREA